MKTGHHHHHRACCPFHALMLWPGGMGAGRDTPAPAGDAPSFSDATPKEASPAASAGDAHTRDLYEVAGRDRLVVIRGATVLPMTNGGSLSNHDIVMRNGVIIDVLPSDGHRPADDALLIDAAGKYVIPGLTEIHTHPILAHSAAMFAPAISPDAKAQDLYLPYDLQMFLYVAAGVTRIEIMAGTAEELAMRGSIRSGRYRGPAMRIASPVIDGYPPMQPPAISLIATDADGGRRAARWIAERGFDFAKPYTRINREAYTAFADECRSLGIMMMGHVPKAVGVEDAIALGHRGVAHVFEFFDWEQEPTRSDPEVMARRARLCAEHG
ncbi:MAG TPA: hypothetical protein VLT59_09950, partial [Steroidobacteraceae bacterium]|nr:hypothetical protein [Steroidobacteraceae bacterium]